MLDFISSFSIGCMFSLFFLVVFWVIAPSFFPFGKKLRLVILGYCLLVFFVLFIIAGLTITNTETESASLGDALGLISSGLCTLFVVYKSRKAKKILMIKI